MPEGAHQVIPNLGDPGIMAMLVLCTTEQFHLIGGIPQAE
jgi:hypothetical protein